MKCVVQPVSMMYDCVWESGLGVIVLHDCQVDEVVV